jgi:hypothetical protein
MKQTWLFFIRHLFDHDPELEESVVDFLTISSRFSHLLLATTLGAKRWCSATCGCGRG